MRSVNRDQKAGMERREKKKFARGDERDVGWLCVNIGRTRSTGNQPQPRCYLRAAECTRGRLPWPKLDSATSSILRHVRSATTSGRGDPSG